MMYSKCIFDLADYGFDTKPLVRAIEEGFISDGGTCIPDKLVGLPRLTYLYVQHDLHYSKYMDPPVDRKQADIVLKLGIQMAAAREAEGARWYDVMSYYRKYRLRRLSYLVYAAVRKFGQSHYEGLGRPD